MKKRLLIIVVIAAAVIAIAWGAVNLLLFKTLSEKKVDSFLTDSQGAFLSPMSQESEGGERAPDADLTVNIAAAAYVSQKGNDLTKVGSAYLIPAEDMEKEVSELFYEGSTDGFEGSGAVTPDENGDYLYTPADADDEAGFEIIDSFYGYVGSEPTTLTVRYTCGSRSCEVDYTLAADQDSPYTFVITDLTVRN